MKTILKSLLLFVAVSTVTLQSCKKQDVNQLVPPSTLSREASAQQAAAIKLMNLFKESSGMETGRIADDFDCAVITVDSTTGPGHSAIIDFGPTGCTTSGGAVFTGRITVNTTTNDLDITGTEAWINYQDFSVDGSALVNGSIYVQNTGLNPNGHKVFNYTLNFITTGTVSNLRFNGTMNFVETVDDKGTPNVSDDVATQTGSGSGDVAGVPYTQTITEDLVILDQAGCEGIYVDGKVLFQLNGHSDEVTDYGDGTCDNIATFEIDGVVRHFYID